MIGWQPPEPITCESRVHRKGGGAYDSSGYHFDIYRDNRFTDFLWQLDCCVSCLSRPRQEQQEKKIMPTPSANGMGASH